MTATDEARALLASALGVSPGDIAEDTRIGTIEAWDSLGHMRLLLEIETALGHELDPDDAMGIESLEDVARLLAGRAA